ncbi:MAG: hypothetical protein Q7Q73_05595 [Verrucomicrobiota bacterium JB024]|nr:hypothetical protein [Verrucomicrobiota bacterium JB024]
MRKGYFPPNRSGANKRHANKEMGRIHSRVEHAFGRIAQFGVIASGCICQR